jgi:phosphinothricin acetyltransferase
MSLVIRPATPADIPTITRIYGHAVKTGTASFELTPPDEADMAARMQAILNGKFPYFVAEVDGAVAGYAYASFYRTRPAYRFTVENSVYIAPEMQRRGIGKALLVKLIEACTALGYRQMIAVIGDSDQAASIGLHRACGFSDAGNLRAIGWKFGRWLDTPLMQLALGPGAMTLPEDRDSLPRTSSKSEANLH